MQEHAGRLVSSRAPRGLKAATSGSSGTAVAVLRGHRSWAHAHANQFRAMAWNGIAVGERHAYLWGVPLDAGGRRQAALKDALFRRERCSAFALDAALARDFHARLLRRRTTWALGYPSALTRFADECADAGLDGRALGWKAVLTTAEVLKPEQRERMEAVFGCPVADLYGCAEAGVAGVGCERGGLHVPVESVVVDLEPAGDGTHEVLLTDLHNLAEPVLRYRVGDLMTDVPAADAACACGRALPLLGRVFGRAGDTLVFPDGRRVNANLPSYIFKKHGKAGTVREYQFVQFSDGVVELRILAGPAWTEAVRADLAAEVRRVLGLEVAIRTVPRFERRGRGKHRDYVRAEDIGEAAARTGAEAGS
jgi:phenylacetate-CoA ligase